MSRKEIKIGLFGFGCVGYGLYEVLQSTKSLNAEIVSICVKNKNKERPIPIEHFTYNSEDILNNDNINTVVELIDDADAAYEIVKRAMIKGKSVVTANKKMLAEHLEELLELQKIHQVSLLYEASCCASIPIIRNLEEYYDNDLLESIEGIVNGSSNYILTKTLEENLSYAIALQKAQEKGYAESNPALDVKGYDAKYKLQILITHAFGLITKPEDIFNIGIDNIGDLELNYAKEKGYKIKLVALAEKTKENTVYSYVLPKFVRSTDPLSNVNDVFNGVKTRTYFSESQFFVGKGAGAYSTASAVISDISALSYYYKYEYKKFYTDTKMTLCADFDIPVFIKFSSANKNRIIESLKEVKEIYQNQEEGFALGYISILNLKALFNETGQKLSVFVIDNF